VFWGDMHGFFRAFDAKSGKELWKMQLGSGIGPGAISYEVNGKQYIAIVVGRSVSLPAFLGDIGKKLVAATPEAGQLFVFTVE
jgi:alcohol dehydrogenase (cytochrome c)